MLKSKYLCLLLILFCTSSSINIQKTVNTKEILTNNLYIPKINLNRIIYEIDSIQNNVNLNIEIIKDDVNCFVLAGHSGNASIAYFNRLDELELNDIIYFNYNNFKYKYVLKEIYKINKNGYFKIRKYNIPVINLITCDESTNYLQVVYVGYLIPIL